MTASRKRMHALRCTTAIALLTATGSSHSFDAKHESDAGVSELEALMNLEVVSASKFSRQLSDIPAAVTVITAEDIRRSNARSIPEALRFVPGLQVSRITGNSWAVSSRGFHGTFSNKLLVMIDGRSIYSPLFSGVFWDSVDINMLDIERIEVIRGPGSSVWGANAVNGVVNIITRSPDVEPGTTVSADAGTDDYLGGGLRYAGQIDGSLFGKTWLTYKKQDDQDYPAGHRVDDQWRSVTTGFGLKKLSGESEYGMSGHLTHQNVHDPILNSPENLNTSNHLSNDSGSLGFNYQRQLLANAGLSASIYYSANDRKSADYDIYEDLFNIELDNKIEQQSFRWTWGLGYREHNFNLLGKETFIVHNKDVDARILSGYLQQEWFLTDASTLTLGLKYENHWHTKSGEVDQFLPTARFLHNLNQEHAFWLAASRSARVPSLAEHFVTIRLDQIPAFSASNPTPWPVETRITSNPDFDSETAWIYEAGLRGHFTDNVSYDLATHYTDFDDIRGATLGQPFCENTGLAPPRCTLPDTLVQPLHFDNLTNASIYGGEVSFRWAMTHRHQLHAGYHYMRIDEHTREGQIAEQSLSFSPLHQAFLVHDWDMSERWSARAGFRYVDDYRNGLLAGYEALDLTFSYALNPNAHLRFGAKDIFHDGDQEGIVESTRLNIDARVIRTSAFIQAEARF